MFTYRVVESWHPLLAPRERYPYVGPLFQRITAETPYVDIPNQTAIALARKLNRIHADNPNRWFYAQRWPTGD